MSFITNTAFLPRVWNNRNDDTQNLAGVYGSINATTLAFTAMDCSAGLLCNLAGAGSDKILRFVVYASGTEIYFCNPGDVQRLSDQSGRLYAVGCTTLGLGLPSGVVGTFTRCKVGEVYGFGAGNFTTVPDSDNPYVVPGSNGLLTAQSSAPASGIYFEVYNLGTDYWTEGNTSVKRRYNLICMSK